MSQQFPETPSQRDSNNSSALLADYNAHYQEFAYASQSSGEEPLSNEYATIFASFQQPIVDHNHTPLPHQVAQTNGNLPPAQGGHGTEDQHLGLISHWDDTAFDMYRLGCFDVGTAFYGTSLNFQYGEVETQPAFLMASTAPHYDFNSVQDIDQSDMSITAGTQIVPMSFSAPPAHFPAPAPAPAAADRIHCPHGCPTTFGRGGEYRRHLRIHQAPRYRCPMVDCPKTFSRADKLRDHAKKGHGGRNPLNL